jgi:hypothetical protein
MQCMRDVGLSREQLESDYGRRCVRSSRFIFLETLTPSLVIFFTEVSVVRDCPQLHPTSVICFRSPLVEYYTPTCTALMLLFGPGLEILIIISSETETEMKILIGCRTWPYWLRGSTLDELAGGK